MMKNNPNNWIDSEWYKEWERLAKDRVTPPPKDLGVWYYDDINKKYIYNFFFKE